MVLHTASRYVQGPVLDSDEPRVDVCSPSDTMCLPAPVSGMNLTVRLLEQIVSSHGKGEEKRQMLFLITEVLRKSPTLLTFSIANSKAHAVGSRRPVCNTLMSSFRIVQEGCIAAGPGSHYSAAGFRVPTLGFLALVSDEVKSRGRLSARSNSTCVACELIS